MHIMRLLLLTAALLLSALCVSAATTTATAASAASHPLPSTEVAVLRAQLETTKQFHDAYMTVTVWALGTAVAIVLALALFSWFTSKSNYERDRAFLEEKVTQLRAEISTLSEKASSQIQTETTAALESRQAAITKSIEASIAQKLTSLSRRITESKGLALDLHIAAKLEKASQSVGQKMYDFAIVEYCEAISLQVQRGSDSYLAGDVFDKINETLRVPGLSISADNLTDAIATLEALPVAHKHITDSMIPRLKSFLR